MLVYVAGCATTSQSVIRNAPVTPSAPLTQDEAALVEGIFGDEVDTRIVTKYFKDFDPKNAGTAARVLTPKTIEFYKKHNHSANHSLEDHWAYGTFIHEMTHIWQKQNPGKNVKHCTVYEYALSLQSRFTDYCSEQQAAIIEDYTLRFLHPYHKSYYATNNESADALLKKVVEDHFPRALETRLSYEAREKLKAPPALSAFPSS